MKNIKIPFNEAELSQLINAAMASESSNVTEFWNAVEAESIQREELELAKPVVPEVKLRH